MTQLPEVKWKPYIAETPVKVNFNRSTIIESDRSNPNVFNKFQEMLEKWIELGIVARVEVSDNDELNTVTYSLWGDAITMHSLLLPEGNRTS